MLGWDDLPHAVREHASNEFAKKMRSDVATQGDLRRALGRAREEYEQEAQACAKAKAEVSASEQRAVTELAACAVESGPASEVRALLRGRNA